VTEEAFDGIDVALFSARRTSREAPKAAARGATVIDNSSAWRMDPEVPLCVPEVNLDAARVRPKGIIANPNCSTIQMVVALKPLHDEARIRRIVVSTYQAISGAGAKAVESFEKQLAAFVRGGELDTSVLGGQLAGNLLMQWKRDVARLPGGRPMSRRRARSRRSVDPRVADRRLRAGANAHESIASSRWPMTADRARELPPRRAGCGRLRGQVIRSRSTRAAGRRARRPRPRTSETPAGLMGGGQPARRGPTPCRSSSACSSDVLQRAGQAPAASPQ
jgi:hypothetical protein